MTDDKKITVGSLYLGMLLVGLGHEVAGAVVSAISALLFLGIVFVERQRADEIEAMKVEIKKISDRIQNMEMARHMGR